MQCIDVVSWNEEKKWKSEIFDSWKYHHTQSKNNKSTWPNAYHVCNLPVAVDGLFLDQCARGLTMLGMPFFYCQNNHLLVGLDVCKASLDLAVIKGQMLKSLETTTLGNSLAFLTESVIQFLLNCVFCDENSPVLQNFHVVPMIVVSVATQWFQVNGDPKVVMQVLDKYCRQNWKNWGVSFRILETIIGCWILQ
jgi:hypothetical protein